MYMYCCPPGETGDVNGRRGSSRDKAPGAAVKKRKLSTIAERLRASDLFVVDLLETCTVPGETMSLPELQESSARMLKVTGVAGLEMF